ncbi:MAG: AMP-binding protein [Proteobacteria bacterium]|nr:AMP-binding protein [Pseudomonadota bacterium]
MAEEKDREQLDVAKTLDQKNVLLIGTTGFVGKVVLSMLLCRYPNIGRIYALVRPGMGDTAEERFFDKVARSPAFDPLREMWQDGYDSFLREKIVPIAGDIGRPRCNFDDNQIGQFADHGISAIINSAGLVSFMPSLESAIRINALGAKNVLDVARATGAHLLHVSTCYVAGRRDGEVWEDEPVIGYFPRHDELRTDDFSAEAEIADCQRIIEQVRTLANDRAHISQFREQAAESLRAQRRDPDNKQTLRLAVARERKLWMHKRLQELGQERAEHWGWTNTYTYTKSLGEQVILADKDVRATVLRPAIVESSVRYPFAGWNEGFNTTAPLIYLALKGHRHIVAGHRTPLDIIPVDMVSAAMIQATAALIANCHKPVYQCGTSDINPVYTERLTELSSLAIRRYYRELADSGEEPFRNRLRARLEPFPVEYKRFQRFSAPQFKRVADRIGDEIDRRLPRWGAPRLTAVAERAQEQLARVSEFAGQAIDVIELFKAFTFDHDIRFRCDNTRGLNAQLTAHDREVLRWDPDAINWRSYWFDSHFPGLQKWVFPILDDEFGPKQRSVYTYKDLVELFDAATKLNKHRVAMRLMPKRGDEPVVYTYERIQDMAAQGAGSLRQLGIAGGDRVMLMSENRPEWAISYFAILKAGATAVPLDSGLSLPEVSNLAQSSGARLLIASADVADRLLSENGIATPMRGDDIEVSAALSALGRAIASAMANDSGDPGAAGSDVAQPVLDVGVLGFDDILVEPAVSPMAVARPRLGGTTASLIYTSGTTGEPKGVMLSHKNLTSMTAKMSSLFKLYRHDGLLSVLPLHHTFEFAAGLLMPLVHGSSITYLEEIGPESLSDALAEGHITSMVGVPALWQLIHRKIFSVVADRGPLLRRAVDAVVELSRMIAEKTGFNPGKLLFFPVHSKLGGRLRLLISGGSALPSDVMKSFHGLGFRLYEGYGMTEASPVIAVMRPNEKTAIGSVGRALPGVDIKIDQPDDSGIGEVVTKGPNVMEGYYHNPEATSAVLRAGWLHTGDLGRLDRDGNLYIVGRKKDMILGTSGENVYPDELEAIYSDSPYIKELSIVGLPSGHTGETVAALIVPEYGKDGLSREVIRQRLLQHVQDLTKQLPLHKRLKVYHLWDHDLPKTSTRKVKRGEVVAELSRLEAAAARASQARKERPEGGEPGQRSSTDWIRDVIAQVAQKKRSQVQPETRLDELGYDSLMFTELGVALEAAGVTLSDPAALTDLDTVADVENYTAQHGIEAEAGGRKDGRKERVKKGKRDHESGDDEEIAVPDLWVRIGRRALRMGQRMAYQRLYDTDVSGEAYAPPTGGYIVAANHASHLDMGLVKHALGEQGELLVALAARDYFFDDPVRRAYFENFTNLVPMERYGSLRESLRLAGDVIRSGHILLIFPEGTRSKTGVMSDFKPSLGYLSLTNQCGILPMYLGGTYDAFPKGAYLPRLPKHRDLVARIGPFVPYERLSEMKRGVSRSQSYRRIAAHIERQVRRQVPAEYEWTLGESGREPLAQVAEQAANPARPDPAAGSAEPVSSKREVGR